MYDILPNLRSWPGSRQSTICKPAITSSVLAGTAPVSHFLACLNTPIRHKKHDNQATKPPATITFLKTSHDCLRNTSRLWFHPDRATYPTELRLLQYYFYLFQLAENHIYAAKTNHTLIPQDNTCTGFVVNTQAVRRTRVL